MSDREQIYSQSSGGISSPNFNQTQLSRLIDPQTQDQFMMEHPQYSQMLHQLKRQLQLDRIPWQLIFNPDNIQMENQLEQLKRQEEIILKKQEQLRSQIRDLSHIKRDLLKQSQGISKMKQIMKQSMQKAQKELEQANQQFIQQFNSKTQDKSKVAKQIDDKKEQMQQNDKVQKQQVENILSSIIKYRQTQQKKNQQLKDKKSKLQQDFNEFKKGIQQNIRQQDQKLWKQQQRALEIELVQKNKYLKRLVQCNDSRNKQKGDEYKQQQADEDREGNRRGSGQRRQSIRLSKILYE